MEKHTHDNALENDIAASVAIPLINKLQAYDHSLDTEFIVKAVDFAVHYHGTQKRASGEPYYQHPLAVAEILADMRLDKITIVTALLHDTIEDTDATQEIITAEFGEEIAQLVEGVTKLTKIETQSPSEREAENFRKFFIAMSEDIRVLIVKLADRLHNMRTLKYIKKTEKRVRISRETMEIYASLAERIGMQNIKNELQDIAFREIYPKAYMSVMNRLDYLHKADDARIERTVNHLSKLLKEGEINADITGRVKTPFSIWRKMQRKNITFEQLSDIMAFRIIVDTKQDCYQTLGAIHSAYHMIPGTFKDFISTPKKNGYQSIHSVVMGPEQQRIEVQIRTTEMHNIAELGLAAHWSYKQGKPENVEGRQYRWIRELLQIIENASDSDDLMETTKLEMYHDQVFCFSPRGDLIALPKNATPVDFAFNVHTDVGRRCVGAKVNGRIVPLRTKLSNGDQVEILLSKSQAPLASWSHFAVTGKAISEIKKTNRVEQRKEYTALGKQILSTFLQSFETELDEAKIEPLLDMLKKKSIEHLYEEIGEGNIDRVEIAQLMFPEKFKDFKKKKSLLSKIGFGKKDAQENSVSIPIMGLKSGVAIHFANCCYALPGEKIAGILNHDQGIAIHTSDCYELEGYADQPDKWVNVSWETEGQTDGVYVARLEAILKHQTGSLAKLADAISKGKANINNLRIVDRSTDFFEMQVDVEVNSLLHLQNVIEHLRNERCINSVWRQKQDK